MTTHEEFIHSVAALVTQEGINNATAEDRAAIGQIKLAYGYSLGVYGVTYYRRWNCGDGNGCQHKEEEAREFVEISAAHQEDWRQIAITTIHELGHVCAGLGAGHGKDWKVACERLGLRRHKAVSRYHLFSQIEPKLRFAIAALPKPDEGSPQPLTAGPRGGKPKPCTTGIGTKGGTSRGAGSGSRLIKCECSDCGYVARTTRKWLDAKGTPHCPEHGAMQET